MPTIFSTREVGELFGVREWQVRRLYEDGTLPEPGRFAGKRVIARADLPTVLDALRARGWVPVECCEEVPSQ
jgi:hypothetical protein